MKVSITDESKKFLTVCEMPIARRIVSDFKADEYSVADYARMASHVFANTDFRIYDATAEISKNDRVWNRYCDGSGHLDIYIQFKAYDPYYGFYDAGIYLSDIWDMTGDNYDAILPHMLVRSYTHRA